MKWTLQVNGPSPILDPGDRKNTPFIPFRQVGLAHTIFIFASLPSTNLLHTFVIPGGLSVPRLLMALVLLHSGPWFLHWYPPPILASLLRFTLQTLDRNLRLLFYVHSTITLSIHISWILLLSLFSVLSPGIESMFLSLTSFARIICIFRNRCNWWSFSRVSQREVKTLWGEVLGTGEMSRGLFSLPPTKLL